MHAVAEVGDEIIVDANRLDQPVRKGEVLEVRGAPDHPHYVVRWDDGHESIYFPSSDAKIKHTGA